jgi:hypothetical protein
VRGACVDLHIVDGVQSRGVRKARGGDVERCMRALLQDAASAFTAHSARERLRARLQQEFDRDEVRSAARVCKRHACAVPSPPYRLDPARFLRPQHAGVMRAV